MVAWTRTILLRGHCLSACKGRPLSGQEGKREERCLTPFKDVLRFLSSMFYRCECANWVNYVGTEAELLAVTSICGLAHAVFAESVSTTSRSVAEGRGEERRTSHPGQCLKVVFINCMLLCCVMVPAVENGIAFILTQQCRLSAVLCFVLIMTVKSLVQ